MCFKALKDLPGPYIKWFVQDLKLEGFTKILMAYEDKSATAKVVFAYGERDKDGKPTEPSMLSFIFIERILNHDILTLFRIIHRHS